MPARWLDLGWTIGPWAATITRQFGLPRVLDTYERQFITCSGVGGASTWILNGETIANWPDDTRSCEFEVTGKLLPRNRLEVQLESASETGGLWGEVALEIRGSCFLQDVAILEGKLTGLVVGEPETPLELYVLRYGNTVRYDKVSATESGLPFLYDLEGILDDTGPQSAAAPWRVELVEGANRWFTVELQDG